MENTQRKKLRNLSIGALLTALGLIIPLFMPAKIVIGPASFTLAAHVPIMAAMFFSPYMTAFVAVATTFGFLLALPVPLIWMRAATHILAMTAGAFVLRKYPGLVAQKLGMQLFNVVLAFVHAGLETLVVLGFYQLGLAPISSAALTSLLLLVFFGGMLHSFIDFNLAFGLCKVINKVYGIDVLRRSKSVKTA